jgi:uncharacterized protein
MSTNTGPKNPRKLFLNLPVRDLQKSIAFFTALGFEFSPQFTDEHATCMLIGEDAFAMLLDHARFADFARRPIGDATTATAGIFAFAAADRAEVDRLAEAAFAAGATKAGDTSDMGFMYLRSFYDLDGHHWEVFYMDPSALTK